MSQLVRQLLVVLVSALSFVPGGVARAETPESDLERLAAMMTGTFSSEAQAAADPEFRDVRLHVARIWRDRGDAVWLYLEQAMADSLARPYRQRVYKLTRSDSGWFESTVYELPGDDLAFAGAWKSPESFPLADPAALEIRPGCKVILEKKSDSLFSGATDGRKCESKLRGAAFATSRVTVRPESLTTWDRGYDAEGKQVWGSTKGAYTFDRVGE